MPVTRSKTPEEREEEKRVARTVADRLALGELLEGTLMETMAGGTAFIVHEGNYQVAVMVNIQDVHGPLMQSDWRTL